MHLEEIKDLLIQAGYGPSWTPELQDERDRIQEIENTLQDCARILKVKRVAVDNAVNLLKRLLHGKL